MNFNTYVLFHAFLVGSYTFFAFGAIYWITFFISNIINDTSKFSIWLDKLEDYYMDFGENFNKKFLRMFSADISLISTGAKYLIYNLLFLSFAIIVVVVFTRNWSWISSYSNEAVAQMQKLNYGSSSFWFSYIFDLGFSFLELFVFLYVFFIFESFSALKKLKWTDISMLINARKKVDTTSTFTGKNKAETPEKQKELQIIKKKRHEETLKTEIKKPTPPIKKTITKNDPADRLEDILYKLTVEKENLELKTQLAEAQRNLFETKKQLAQTEKDFTYYINNILNNDSPVIISEDTDHPFQLNNDTIRTTYEICKNLETDREKAKAIFDWFMKGNVIYGKKFRGNVGYRNSLEVYETKEGVCGEMATLYISMVRVVLGIKRAKYVSVRKDRDGKEVYHACASVLLDGKEVLVDPAYHEFDVKHLAYKIKNDADAVKDLKRFRQNIKEDSKAASRNSTSAFNYLKSKTNSEKVIANLSDIEQKINSMDISVVCNVLGIVGDDHNIDKVIAHLDKVLFENDDKSI